MDKCRFLIILIPTIFFFNSYSQESSEKISELFLNEEMISIGLRYSNKDIKKATNDSTYLKTFLRFEDKNQLWDSLEVSIRKRGNFRLQNCYYAPLKVKLKKKETNNTLFEGHKNLKMVLPCLIQKDNNDNVVKEYLAYKLYELVSPYHFKTRLVHFDYEEVRGKKIKLHKIKAFFIEDDKHVAKRIGGKVLESNLHPMNHEPLESVRNAFFQFMIGNTDFSNAYQHNSKLIFKDGQIIPVPYDFDMAGIVNSSYSTVSQINEQELSIEKVTQRLYRGFQRDPSLFNQVRLEFIDHKPEILGCIQKCELLFENEREYISTINFIEEFFEIMQNDQKFEKHILAMARQN